MHFLVVGCGSIGQRFIRNLKVMGIGVSGCEINSYRAKEVRKLYGIRVFGTTEEALKAVYDGVFVCTPTSSHIQIATKAARNGINLFIEKPLSDSLRGVDDLASIISDRKLVSLIGCNTRFLPSFIRARDLVKGKRIGNVLSVRMECGFYLPYWHPERDYSREYSANRSMGGGVILDDIHEIDALYSIFGKPEEVFCYAAKASNLKIDTEDLAEIILRFKSGVIAQIHLDYLQRTYRRYYEFIGEKGVVVWDYITQNVDLFDENTNRRKTFQESINVYRETMFVNEIDHFIRCIRGREASVNDISSAKEILKIALACRESSKKRKIIKL